MASTNIDGSPIHIIDREQAEDIARLLHIVEEEYGLTDTMWALVRRLRYTFPDLKLPTSS